MKGRPQRQVLRLRAHGGKPIIDDVPRRPIGVVLAALTLVACAPEVPSEEDVSSRSDPVLGDYTEDHPFNCDDDYPPIIEDMVFAMRVTAASDDFEQALRDYVACREGAPTSCGYWPIQREPYSPGSSSARGWRVRFG